MEGYPKAVKKMTFVGLLVTSLVFSGSSANAAVSCNSVKASIIKIETKILREIKYFQTLPTDLDGAIFVQSGSVEYKKLIAFGETTLLYDVWRLGTNNPKCFTNTQKIALKAPSFKKPESYINWSFYSAGDLRLFFETKYRSIYKY